MGAGVGRWLGAALVATGVATGVRLRIGGGLLEAGGQVGGEGVFHGTWDGGVDRLDLALGAAAEAHDEAVVLGLPPGAAHVALGADGLAVDLLEHVAGAQADAAGGTGGIEGGQAGGLEVGAQAAGDDRAALERSVDSGEELDQIGRTGMPQPALEALVVFLAGARLHQYQEVREVNSCCNRE